MSDRRQHHNAYQRRVFAESVEFFRRPPPEDVQRSTRRIVAAAGLRAHEHVLDVGTGTGALIEHIRREGVARIVGCDLSPAMVAEARRTHPDVSFWCGDVVDLPAELGPFDVVFFNAVFGNVWSQREALEATAARLREGARVVISHPMGSGFVEKLRRDDPRLVPHLLPDERRLAELIRGLPYAVRTFRDAPSLYLCVLGYAA